MTNPEPYQLLPALSAEEYEALRDDIAEHGIRVPIDVDMAGTILDGHHRKRIADELGVDCPTRTVTSVFTDEQKREYALAVNLARRHLTSAQKRELIAAELDRDDSRSDRAIARLLGVDHKTVGAVRRAQGGEIPQEPMTLVDPATLSTPELKDYIRRLCATDLKDYIRQVDKHQAAAVEALRRRGEEPPENLVFREEAEPEQMTREEAERRTAEVRAGLAKIDADIAEWLRSGISPQEIAGTIAAAWQTSPPDIPEDAREAIWRSVVQPRVKALRAADEPTEPHVVNIGWHDGRHWRARLVTEDPGLTHDVLDVLETKPEDLAETVGMTVEATQKWREKVWDALTSDDWQFPDHDDDKPYWIIFESAAREDIFPPLKRTEDGNWVDARWINGEVVYGKWVNGELVYEKEE